LSDVGVPAEAERSPSLSRTLVLSVFLPFAAGYFLSYLYRSINAVIAPDLVADAGLAAADLGFLTSVYFLTFAALQLPVGLALDRFGPRRVAASLLLLAATGATVFAFADGLAGLTLGRGLIGAGVSACLMSSFKAFSLWFSPQRLPAINGMLLAFGGLGAISATAPVEWLLTITDWRVLFLGLALTTAVAALAIFTIVPEQQQASGHGSLSDQLAGLRRVFCDAFFWRVAPIGAISAGASQAVLGLWAGPWLRDVAGFARAEVATHLFIAACATAAGFLLSGLITERLSRMGVAPVKVVGAGMTAFMLMMILLASGGVGPVWLLLIGFAFLATSGTVNYALVSQYFGTQLAGRANTALNLLVFIASFLMQWLLGVVIGFWEDPVTLQYADQGYHVAFGGLAALQALALFWFFGPGRRRAGG
jgi:predicted MFS family arabinose efflux permease